MTIQLASLYKTGSGPSRSAWNTSLDASDTVAKEQLGAIRFDYNPHYGIRGFVYIRSDGSGTTAQGTVLAQADNVAINNITSGTTTSITTAGLTADIHVNGLLYCLDDAGAAGAAPEGESARIIKNTATVITIDPNDAFSVSPAANDDFVIIKPWATRVASTDVAAIVKGVLMASQPQYSYGWAQFLGINPFVLGVAAGTTIPAGESVITAAGGLVTDGAGANVELRIGRIQHQLTTDTVARRAIVDLFCGPAFGLSNSTA